MKLRILSIPLFLVLALLFCGCEKEKIDNTDQDHPIQLTVTKPGRNVILEWTATNISNFENYVLVRSTEPIDDPLEPIGAFATVEDFEENTFEDTAFPLAEKVYYKVYAKVGDRFLFSPTVPIEFDVKLLDLRATRTAYAEESDVLFLYDNNMQTIFSFDVEAGEITNELTEQNVFDYVMDAGDVGEGPELILSPNGSNQIAIYDDELNFKTSQSFNASIVDIEIGEGVIVIGKNSFNATIDILNRSNLNSLGTVSGSEQFDRRLKLLPSGNKTLVEIGFDGVFKYTFNSNWGLTSIQNETLFSNPLQEIAASSDGVHFIPNLEGNVFGENLNSLGTVNAPSTNFSQEYIFSKDGTKVYAFNFSPGEIIEFSFPELEILREVPLNYSPMKAYQREDGQFVIVGLVLNAFPQKTFVDVLDLQ